MTSRIARATSSRTTVSRPPHPTPTRTTPSLLTLSLTHLVTQLFVENHDLQVRFRWGQNDLAIWDNRSAFHTATKYVIYLICNTADKRSLRKRRRRRRNVSLTTWLCHLVIMSVSAGGTALFPWGRSRILTRGRNLGGRRWVLSRGTEVCEDCTPIGYLISHMAGCLLFVELDRDVRWREETFLRRHGRRCRPAQAKRYFRLTAPKGQGIFIVYLNVLLAQLLDHNKISEIILYGLDCRLPIQVD